MAGSMANVGRHLGAWVSVQLGAALKSNRAVIVYLLGVKQINIDVNKMNCDTAGLQAGTL